MFRSPHPDVEIPNLSVYDYLFGSITPAQLDRVAITDGSTGNHVTYRELLLQVDAIAGDLAAQGIGVGDVVALHSPNSPAFVATFHGILRSGATVTTINALATAADITSQLTNARATRLITVSVLLSQASDAAGRAGLGDDAVIVLDGADGHRSFADLVSSGLHAPPVAFDPTTHLAILPYSSGTTALPKGVMLTHRNLVANVAQVVPMIEVNADDHVLAVLPFFHIYGITVLLNLALRTRAALVTMPRFDLLEFLRIVQDERCTYLFIAPPIAVALAKHPVIDDYDLSSVRSVLSGAAPLDEAIAGAVATRLDCRVLQGYGMTEMSPVAQVHRLNQPETPLGSVGVTVPNMDCRLVDPETGDEIPVPKVGVSAAGELQCRGPNIMAGYLGNDAATREAFTEDGFLRTGDIATISAEGFVTIIDRVKELIKYKGYQVAPAELEAVLLSHPSIADAAVIGVTDPEGEEVPQAFVVLQPGSSVASDEIIAFVAERVAPYKKVRQVEMIDVIPKSASGKILRRDLRASAVRT